MPLNPDEIVKSKQPLAPERLLILDDEICQKIALLWFKVSPAVLLGESYSDLAHECARLVGCEPEEAASRVAALVALDIVQWDGSVHDKAVEYLQAKAAARINGLEGQDHGNVAKSWMLKQKAADLRAWLKMNRPDVLEEVN